MNLNSITRSAEGDGQEEGDNDFVGKPTPKKCKKKICPVFSHTKLLLGKAYRALDDLECPEAVCAQNRKGSSGKAQ